MDPSNYMGGRLQSRIAWFALKTRAGNQHLWTGEILSFLQVSINWVIYNFPAAKTKRIILDTFKYGNGWKFLCTIQLFNTSIHIL